MVSLYDGVVGRNQLLLCTVCLPWLAVSQSIHVVLVDEDKLGTRELFAPYGR
jgi:hypothetical protein